MQGMFATLGLMTVMAFGLIPQIVNLIDQSFVLTIGRDI